MQVFVKFCAAIKRMFVKQQFVIQFRMNILLNANNERSYKMVKFVRHARQLECLRARDVRIFRFGRDVVQIGKRWLRALESAPYRARLGQRSQGQICFLVTSLVAHFNTPPRI